MMKKLFLLLAAAAGLSLAAAELTYKNPFFEVRFDTRGGVIKHLVHKGTAWGGSRADFSSFDDLRVGRIVKPNCQEHEDFSKINYAVREWQVRGPASAVITFAARGLVFTALQLEKSYFFDGKAPNELTVAYTLRNTGDTPLDAFLSLRTFFHREGKKDTFLLPKAVPGKPRGPMDFSTAAPGPCTGSSAAAFLRRSSSAMRVPWRPARSASSPSS